MKNTEKVARLVIKGSATNPPLLYVELIKEVIKKEREVKLATTCYHNYRRWIKFLVNGSECQNKLARFVKDEKATGDKYGGYLMVRLSNVEKVSTILNNFAEKQSNQKFAPLWTMRKTKMS